MNNHNIKIRISPSTISREVSSNNSHRNLHSSPSNTQVRARSSRSCARLRSVVTGKMVTASMETSVLSLTGAMSYKNESISRKTTRQSCARNSTALSTIAAMVSVALLSTRGPPRPSPHRSHLTAVRRSAAVWRLPAYPSRVRRKGNLRIRTI